ncbi:MAG: XdhC family protein [Deltaproteobacteria bacterium]|nr:XdhC family protein [Deltaproteobacteria bacterium]
MGDVEINAYQLLKQGVPLVLATVLKSGGSTPRTAGARMLVRADGSISGTIGGGKVEAAVIEEALTLFSSRDAVIRYFDLTNRDTRSSLDMICGGQMTVLAEYVAATPENVAVFEVFTRQVEKRQHLFVLGRLGKSVNDRLPSVRRTIIDDASEKEVNLPAGLIRTFKEKIRKSRHSLLAETQDQGFLLEPVFVPGTVYLFGGGHVSLCTADFTHRVGFRTEILDDRHEFANARRFPFADGVRVLDSFEQAFVGLSIDRDSYVVIVTRGHLHDKTVLAQALGTPAGYIGMIGSRRKRDAIYAVLLDEGFSKADIERVYSPIGIEIHAQTPEEIAVSIVAELIAHRNQDS